MTGSLDNEEKREKGTQPQKFMKKKHSPSNMMLSHHLVITLLATATASAAARPTDLFANRPMYVELFVLQWAPASLFSPHDTAPFPPSPPQQRSVFITGIVSEASWQAERTPY
jgi:hypothetical protein